MLFTTKADLQFDPAPGAVAVDAAGVAYTTPSAWQRTLADLARLPYVNATLRYTVAQSAKPAAGAATLMLMAGSTTVASVALDLTSAQTLRGTLDVDLSTLAGQTALSLQLSIGTAATSGTTAQVYGALDVDVPLTVGNC